MEDYRFSYLAYLGDQHNSYVVVFWWRAWQIILTDN